MPTAPEPAVWLILPTYDEAANIEALVAAVLGSAAPHDAGC